MDVPELPNFDMPKLPNDFNMGDIALDMFSDKKRVDITIDFQCRYIKPPLCVDVEKHVKYEYADDLARDIVIDKGSRYFCVVNGSFIFGDFIEALVVRNNWHIKRMTISTLGLSQNNVDSLYNLISGNFVDELNLILSGFFFSHERHDLIPYIYQELDKDNKFQLAVAETHCKMCIFETYCGKFIVIDGSANLRSSDSIEQFRVEESEELYNFNNEYQDRIIDLFKTINKRVGGKTLWQKIKGDVGQEGKKKR